MNSVLLLQICLRTFQIFYLDLELILWISSSLSFKLFCQIIRSSSSLPLIFLKRHSLSTSIWILNLLVNWTIWVSEAALCSSEFKLSFVCASIFDKALRLDLIFRRILPVYCLKLTHNNTRLYIHLLDWWETSFVIWVFILLISFFLLRFWSWFLTLSFESSYILEYFI